MAVAWPRTQASAFPLKHRSHRLLALSHSTDGSLLDESHSRLCFRKPHEIEGATCYHDTTRERVLHSGPLATKTRCVALRERGCNQRSPLSIALGSILPSGHPSRVSTSSLRSGPSRFSNTDACMSAKRISPIVDCAHSLTMSRQPLRAVCSSPISDLSPDASKCLHDPFGECRLLGSNPCDRDPKHGLPRYPHLPANA